MNSGKAVCPTLGVKGVVADLVFFAIPSEASAPHERGKPDDEQVKPSQHPRLGAVPELMAQSDGIILMGGTKKNVFAQGNASVGRLKMIVVSCRCGFRKMLYAQSKQHLRKAPDPKQYFHKTPD